MEKVVLVKNDNVKEVNALLSQGWKVKLIQPCAQVVSAYAYGYAGGESGFANHSSGHHKGDIYAYVVLEKLRS